MMEFSHNIQWKLIIFIFKERIFIILIFKKNILHIADGKKLFSEAFWEYGCMLLLLDNLIIGSVREKIVIAYLRYKGSLEAIPHINEVCKLCKNTYYLPPQYNKGEAKRPPNYPEEFFGRFFIEGNRFVL